MPRARLANGIELEYDTFGDPTNPPLVLVMGLGAQMILWEEDFCRDLAAAGFHVVRFDNRDVGMSTQLDQLGLPNVFEAMAAAFAGKLVDAPYTLDDMADDTVAFMDVLGIARAHVVGASMGGMIAQTLAIRHPERLLTMTSIMSTTGDVTLPQASPEAMRVLLTPPPADREGNVARALEAWKVIGSPKFGLDEERMRSIFDRAFDRGYHPAGVARQMTAIMASGDRTAKLRGVTVPSLVIHGDADPLVRIEGGRATAAAIPGAGLVVIEGMGHDLPRGVWPEIVDAIGELARRPHARRLSRAGRGTAVPIERGCDLCEAARLTRWYFEDDVCWVADCEICEVPMVVWRRHGIDPTPEESAHMIAALERAAAELFTTWVVDGHRRNIPDHWHAHARPSGTAALAWWARRFR